MIACCLMLLNGPPAFERVVIDPDVGKVCYAVAAADVDGDGHRDAVAVSETRVVVHAAPDWRPHVILDGATRPDNVCIAAHDVDGDGDLDFALGSGWTKLGDVHWLENPGSLSQPWQAHYVFAEPWTHRMRWADVTGDGRPELVVSALNPGPAAGARVLAFAVPADPRGDRWQPVVMTDVLHRIHNHRRAGDGVLVASQEGVTRFSGKPPTATVLTAGKPGVGEDRGAGEVAVARLGAASALVTVEPMHGDTLALHPLAEGAQRQVIASGFQRGHALATHDFDRDGIDEIVLGHSDTPAGAGIDLYRRGDDGQWTKHVVDVGGMACEDLVVADLTGDGHADILAGGRQTHNLVLYVNAGR